MEALDRLEALLRRSKPSLEPRTGPADKTTGKPRKIVEQSVPAAQKSGDLDAAVKAEHMRTIASIQEAAEMTLLEWCDVVRNECVDLEARLVAVGKTYNVRSDAIDDMVERAVNKIKADAFETIVLNNGEGMG